jgi:hypothetical protein
MSDQNLRSNLSAFISNAEQSGVSLIAVRLRDAWRSVADAQILEHTDNVIYDKRHADIVVVFTDDAHWTADLSAQKEIFRLLLSQALGLPTENYLRELRFVTSRRSFIKHVFMKTQQQQAKLSEKVEPVALNSEEEGHAREMLSRIQNEELKSSLFKAMKSNLEWKKGIEAAKEPLSGKRKPEI